MILLFKIIEERVGKKFNAVNRYRATRDGWKAEDFHRRSDGRGPTITLMRSDKD